MVSKSLSKCVYDVDFMDENPLYFWFAFARILLSGHKVFKADLHLLRYLLTVYAQVDSESLARFASVFYSELLKDKRRLSFDRKFGLDAEDVARFYAVLIKHLHIIANANNIEELGVFSDFKQDFLKILDLISYKYFLFSYPGFLIDLAAVLSKEYFKELHKSVRQFATLFAVKNALLFEKQFMEMVSQRDKLAINQIKKFIRLDDLGTVKKILTLIDFIAVPSSKNIDKNVFKKVTSKNFEPTDKWLEVTHNLIQMLDIHNMVSLADKQVEEAAKKIFVEIEDILLDYPESVCRDVMMKWVKHKLNEF